MRENEIFALDIGTHSVVGILGYMEDEVFCAQDYEQRFHKRGAMRDGQIEDISLVAKAVEEVKEALEERAGYPIERASIAAAGRLLLTAKAEYEEELGADDAITPELIRSIEYGALSAAIEEFGNGEEESVSYSCVGYSVTGYWLDDYKYSNLEGHRGKRARVEIIAAFLPFSVIRSLYSVVETCGLTVDSLTLEPIAAINAIVPVDIRLLNIAIIDIGAGTSDIAISQNGSIVAYDMVTVAGDEMTETLMRRFLVDFETAEKMKYALSGKKEEIAYTNILGITESCAREDIMAALAEAIATLCREVAKRVLDINGCSPVAVFLTGGGSQLPRLDEKVAEELGMPRERVSIGGKRAYKYIRVCSDDMLTPEFVTPLGIGAAYRYTRGHDFFSISVNGRRIMFPQTNEIKVLDALLLAGIKSSDLIGRTPSPLDFVVNGVRRTVRGSHAVPGEIYVNDELSTLDTPVHQGDSMKVVFAKQGTAPRATAGELLQECEGGARVFVNGEEAPPEREIVSGDVVEVAGEEDAGGQARVIVSLNGIPVEIEAEGRNEVLFVDALNFTEIDTETPKGNLVLMLNGRDAAYSDPLSEGDVLEIRWSQEKISETSQTNEKAADIYS